jgi:hypothetical protein
MSAFQTLACPAHPFSGVPPPTPFAHPAATWPSVFPHTSVCTWQYGAYATLFLPTPFDVVTLPSWRWRQYVPPLSYFAPATLKLSWFSSRHSRNIPQQCRTSGHGRFHPRRYNLLLVHRRIIRDTVQSIAQDSRHFWYYGHSWSHTFRPFVTGSDESGCELLAGE